MDPFGRSQATYVDLSVFQLVEGLRYAFPQAMRGIERKVSGLVTVRDKVAVRPGIQGLPRVAAADRLQ